MLALVRYVFGIQLTVLNVQLAIGNKALGSIREILALQVSLMYKKREKSLV